MRRIILALLAVAVCWFASYAASAAELQVPAQVTAGQEFRINTTGSGNATFYLIGPSHLLRKDVKLGEAVSISADDVKSSGRYLAVLRADGEPVSKEFFVVPAKAAKFTFLARPSRVPAGAKGVISGVTFVFDANGNLALAPTTVKFDLSVDGGKALSQTANAKEGIAFTRMDSSRTQGAAQFVASLPGADADSDGNIRRVVQQVAADACNLHMKAERTAEAIIVETDPVKDCSGNPVPDGTIVTFTEVDSSGRSTVDARVKKDIARAELPLSSNATITVAAGVVLGNELHVGGAQ